MNADAQHEALCRRCGISCHFAVPVNGLAVVVDELHCRFLARAADGRFHCTVYERRFEVAPWCHSAAQAASQGLLAQDCPYTHGMRGYRGKVRLGASLLRQVLPAICAEVVRVGVPIGADPEHALALVAQLGGDWDYCISEDGTRYLFFRRDAAPSPRAAAPASGQLGQAGAPADALPDASPSPSQSKAPGAPK
ncbi:MAG: hypothetical protein RMK29_15850 [Myxococcales bacterium]|nr:hypothetical protein [Myxococcales bacterium]